MMSRMEPRLRILLLLAVIIGGVTAPTPARAQVLLSTVSVNPTSVVGGETTNGTVSLTSAAPTGGMVVTLANSNSAAVSAPPTVRVPAGRSAQSFLITTNTVAATTTVTLTGSTAGSTLTRTTTLTVNQTPTPPA